MQHISIGSFKEVIGAEKSNSSVDFINVCTPAEYKEKHIEGVRNVPLSEFAQHAREFEGKKTIYVHCRSGNRSKQAIAELERMGVTAELVNVEGGLMAWTDAGFSTLSLTARMPIIRQVMLVAGLLVVLGAVLAAAVNPLYIYLSFAVGAGLMFSGITGYCGMALVLARMPWNR